jgi:hypothetical protein
MARKLQLASGIEIRYNDDDAPESVLLPNGEIVELPPDFAQAKFVSDAAGFTPHRCFPRYEVTTVGGVTQTRAVYPAEFQFVGGIYPPPGGKLLPQDYAELITHPFLGSKFEQLVIPTVPPEVTPALTVDDLDDEAILRIAAARGLTLPAPDEPMPEPGPEAADPRLAVLAGFAPAPHWACGFALGATLAGATSREAALTFAWSWAENQVQAAIKAVPLGQAAAQRVLAVLAADIPAAVDAALARPAG